MNLFEQIREQVKKIPKGKVSTYGEIAKYLQIKDTRKIGWALHQNKSIECPCHRVVNKEGNLAKGYAFGGEKIQKQILESEGVIFNKDGSVNLQKCLHFFV